LLAEEEREDWFISRFEKYGAVVLKGHFVGASGVHFDCYIDKDLINSDPVFVEELANFLVLVNNDRWMNQIDLVIAPASGAILFGGFIAYHLSCNFAFTKKLDGQEVLRPSFRKLVRKDCRILIAEDIMNRAKSVREVAAEVQRINPSAKIVGAAVIWDRGGVELPFPTRAVVSKRLPFWEAKNCDLCRRKIKINPELGHGREFLEQFSLNPSYWPANKK